MKKGFTAKGPFEVSAFHNLSIVGKTFSGEPDLIGGLTGTYSHHCLPTFYMTIAVPSGRIKGVGWDEKYDLNPISAFPIQEENGGLKTFQVMLGQGKIDLFEYKNPLQLQTRYIIDQDNPFKLED